MATVREGKEREKDPSVRRKGKRDRANTLGLVPLVNVQN